MTLQERPLTNKCFCSQDQCMRPYPLPQIMCYDTGIAALTQGGSEGQKWETTTTNHSLRVKMWKDHSFQPKSHIQTMPFPSSPRITLYYHWTAACHRRRSLMLRTTNGPLGTRDKYNHYRPRRTVHDGTLRWPCGRDRRGGLYKDAHYHYI
jgi:hypothetical protein